MPASIVAYWEALPAWITIGLAVLAALLLAIAIWWLWWWWPKREVARLALKIRDPKARADVEDNYRKTVGQALGGVAILLGAGTAYLQFSQQQQASHDLLISNQVSKGFEQLGSNVIVVRLGGIYALEGVMHNSDQYYRPVLEALSAFARDGSKGEASSSPPTDIQAALTVIGRRSPGPGNVNLVVDLAKAQIAGAALSRADLSWAHLSGTNLSGANLSWADLSVADLSGANLVGADLSVADLSWAHLSGANLSGAILSGANLPGAKLNEAHLNKAILNGADLSRVVGLSQEQLDLACGSDTRLPTGLTLKPCPP